MLSCKYTMCALLHDRHKLRRTSYVNWKLQLFSAIDSKSLLPTVIILRGEFIKHVLLLADWPYRLRLQTKIQTKRHPKNCRSQPSASQMKKCLILCGKTNIFYKTQQINYAVIDYDHYLVITWYPNKLPFKSYT